jgi:hypothetical protein
MPCDLDHGDDNAVRKFRNAAEEVRARMRDDFRIQVQDFTDRVNAEWAAASPKTSTR